MKHKLAGFAIKGDGTKETAERIKKVFEADGLHTFDWSFVCKQLYGVSEEKVIPIGQSCQSYKPIPLTEAEALVFGELKAGMMVVSGATYSWLKKGGIYNIEEWNGSRLRLIPLGTANEVISADNSYLKYLSRATLTDFLRTLPEDIAERALQQVDEDSRYYEAYPESLGQAVACIGEWREKEEGYQFWNYVAHGEYDRARELLRPDKPNTDKFPRMMWVWDDDPNKARYEYVTENDGEDYYPWWVGGLDCFQFASDTHPVTGQPATDKSVVEQIREVVERWEQQLEKYRQTKDNPWEADHNIFKAKYKFQQLRDDLKQIKSFLDRNK